MLFAVTGIALIAADGRARPDHAADPGDGDRPFARLVLPADDPARRRDDHRQPARHDGRALVRAARRPCRCGLDACSPSYALIVAGAVAVLVATLVGGFGAGWTFLPPLPFYPAGQWSVWSESVFLRRTASRRRRVLRLLHRRARADDDDLRRARRARSAAVPARTRAAGAAAAGDRRHRHRDRRADLLRRRQRRSSSGCSAAPTTTRSASTLSSPRTSSTSSATRSRTCRSTSPPPRSTCSCRATPAAPTRRPRCSSPAGSARSSSSPPPTRTTSTWTSSSRRGPTIISAIASYGALDPGRGDHDLLDDDADLGLPLPLDARLDAALRRLRRLGDRRRRRGDRLADPDQLPPPQHHLGRRPLPHLPDAQRRRLGPCASSPICSNATPAEPPRAPPAPGRSR